MASKLSPEQLQEYKDTFALFDKNGDGTISTAELGDVMKALNQGATDSQLKEMINEIDQNKDGTIDFDEFLAMISRDSIAAGDREKELRETFKVFDADGNGYITKAEIESVMKKLGDQLSSEQLDEMLKEADTNGDGKIDYNEFAKMFGAL
ncbi:calmodulin [Atractiella rhizophila]|nr:calmodulin [Atractiella rhizophila]